MSEKFECDHCGACCEGHLIVEVHQIDILRDPHLATAGIDRTPNQTCENLIADLEQDGKCLVIAGGKPCKFLTETFECAIHPTRPNAWVAMQAGDEQCQIARNTAGHLPLEPL